MALLDYYALALVGALSSERESVVSETVRRLFGDSAPWTSVLRKHAGLPEDMDKRIQRLWSTQPSGTDPMQFVRQVSDANFIDLIDAQ